MESSCLPEAHPTIGSLVWHLAMRWNATGWSPGPPAPDRGPAVQPALTDGGIAVVDEAVAVVRTLDDERTASLGGRSAEARALQSALRTLSGSAPEVDPDASPSSGTGGQP